MVFILIRIELCKHVEEVSDLRSKQIPFAYGESDL